MAIPAKADDPSLRLRLSVLPHRYAVCRLSATSSVPTWAQTMSAQIISAQTGLPGDALLSLTRTPDEVSIVCPQSLLPPAAESNSAKLADDKPANAPVRVERDWRCLRVAGPLDFALVGVLARLTNSLAAAGISLFALSTYDTDYLLVKADNLTDAVEALSAVAQVD